ncbi:hypothetical protein LTSEURB_6050, partial [Salmonella enterica subsp. enterica serovar Urbana str. R8-2977]
MLCCGKARILQYASLHHAAPGNESKVRGSDYTM